MRNFILSALNQPEKSQSESRRIDPAILKETRRAVFVEYQGRKAWLRKADIDISEDYIDIPHWLWLEKFSTT